MRHYPVMLNEVIENLSLKENSIVIDATLGAAGHSSFILKQIKKGFLIAFDQDKDEIEKSIETLSQIGNNFSVINSNFAEMKDKVKELGYEKVDAILFDLGTSSMQMDDITRGFNYHEEAILDMRMDRRTKLTAKDIVNTYSKEELLRILKEYSDEKFRLPIVNNILKYREKKEIETTIELAEIIKSSVPQKIRNKKHPARKTFQALRVEVNNELEVLKKALNDALSLLNVGGRLCVITFQTKEDMIVKKLFNEVSKEDLITKGDPFISASFIPEFKKIKRIMPSKKELEENNRSRSAILRVIERVHISEKTKEEI